MSEEVSKYDFIFVDVVHNNLVIKAACERIEIHFMPPMRSNLFENKNFVGFDKYKHFKIMLRFY